MKAYLILLQVYYGISTLSANKPPQNPTKSTFNGKVVLKVSFEERILVSVGFFPFNVFHQLVLFFF